MKTHGLPIVAFVMAIIISLGVNHFTEASFTLLILIAATSMVVIFTVCSHLWSIIEKEAREMGWSSRKLILFYVIGALVLTLLTTPWIF